MYNITKSLYVDYKDCDRLFFLQMSNLIKPQTDPLVERRMKQGNEAGKLAEKLFLDLSIVNYNEDKSIMVNQTQSFINQKRKAIAEASFIHKNLYCACDFLISELDGYSIYEVKSSTKVKKEHLRDIAFQYYVLLNCGLNVKKLYIIHTNNDYILEKELIVKDFFVIDDVTDSVKPFFDQISLDLEAINKITNMPEFSPKSNCSDCIYQKFCFGELPEDSLVNIYNYRNKSKYYNLGLRTMDEVQTVDVNLSDVQKRQIEYFYNEYPLYIEKDNLKTFLNSWDYPLYFLDFETLDYLIPQFEGTKPNQKLPYQASIHILENYNGELNHIELLIDPAKDPREEMIVFLSEHLGESGSVVVYNATFEKTVLKQLAEDFPQYQSEIMNIVNRVVDLLEVFRKGMVYNKEMNGSFSIKDVYPAICPESKNAYKDLEQVHNGSDAVLALEELRDLKSEIKDQRRRQLLEYCKLDTLSMVEIYTKLLELKS